MRMLTDPSTAAAAAAASMMSYNPYGMMPYAGLGATAFPGLARLPGMTSAADYQAAAMAGLQNMSGGQKYISHTSHIHLTMLPEFRWNIEKYIRVGLWNGLLIHRMRM